MKDLLWITAVTAVTAVIASSMLVACGSSPPSNAPGSPSRPPSDAALAESSKAPPAPPEVWSESRDILSLDDSERKEVYLEPRVQFDLPVHDALVSDKLARECSTWLVTAQWDQDITHQLSSTAHFDNCAFEETFTKINSLLDEASKHVEEKSWKHSVFALGRILHTVQDFYAHTNYVEIMAQRYPSDFKQVKSVALWDKAGQDTVRAMIKDDNLISGYVWWGSPKVCASKDPSHTSLNKDGPDTKSGATVVSGWNMNQHQAARQLAEDASLQFLRYAMKRWPFLKEACGKTGAIGYYSKNDRRATE